MAKLFIRCELAMNIITSWCPTAICHQSVVNAFSNTQQCAKLVLQLPLIDLSPFQGSLTHLGGSGGLWRAPKPIVLLWVYRVRRILGHISTFPDLPFQPSEIFMVQHGLYRFSAYSTYMFIFWGYLGPLESVSVLF